MAVYYKFKSERDYNSIPMDGPFISVGTLKEIIVESKHLGRGTDFDLLVTNAQSGEEYLDEAMLIPKNTGVLIRRVPGWPCMPIVTKQLPKVDTQPEKCGFHGVDSSAMNNTDSEWDEFGNDLYAIPEAPPVQSSNPLPDVAPTNKADEDSKIKALIDTPALDWQRQGSDGFAPGRGFRRGMGRRGFGLEFKTPPQGYVCHRCNISGHFIQHCPTNGDPKYDVKRFKHPTGIPKSMLIAIPDGSYALPSDAVAVLRPNGAAFEKEIEGLPSTRSVSDLPPELHCTLCREVMKDAVLTSKCCFNSFCDKCIRDHIISKAMCVCRATNILADDLLPNKTLRDTINHILESGNNSSAENAGSTFQVQDMESARCPLQLKVPSPTMSAPSKGEQKPLASDKETPIAMETADAGKAVITVQQSVKKVLPVANAPDVSEDTLESMSVKEPASHGSAPLVEKELQQKLASGEAAKSQKKKKVHAPANDIQWKTPQDLAAETESYMMPLGPSAYNPYWTGFQPGMEGYMGPLAGSMPYMDYGMGPLHMPLGGVVHRDPFAAQGYMIPVVPPQRDLAEFEIGMGMNVPPHNMSREEFEAPKADVRRKREREFSRDREYGREVSSRGDLSSMKSKSKSTPQASSTDRHRYKSMRSFLETPPRPKRESEHSHLDREQERNCDRVSRHRHIRHCTEASPKPNSTATAAASADKKYNGSVFSRISLPEEEVAAAASKKCKVSSSSQEPVVGAGASAIPHSHSTCLHNGFVVVSFLCMLDPCFTPLTQSIQESDLSSWMSLPP